MRSSPSIRMSSSTISSRQRSLVTRCPHRLDWLRMMKTTRPGFSLTVGAETLRVTSWPSILSTAPGKNRRATGALSRDRVAHVPSVASRIRRYCSVSTIRRSPTRRRAGIDLFVLHGKRRAALAPGSPSLFGCVKERGLTNVDHGPPTAEAAHGGQCGGGTEDTKARRREGEIKLASCLCVFAPSRFMCCLTS